MFTPAKQLIFMGGYYKNLLAYNPTTWEEWGKINAVGDSTGIELSQEAGNRTNIVQNVTGLKPSAKYGLMLNVVSNTLLGDYFYIDGNSFENYIDHPFENGIVGNLSWVIILKSTITNTELYISDNDLKGTGKVKVKDIRLFELPPNSVIEWDFENLTADQLNTKYPF